MSAGGGAAINIRETVFRALPRARFAAGAVPALSPRNRERVPAAFIMRPPTVSPRDLFVDSLQPRAPPAIARATEGADASAHFGRSIDSKGRQYMRRAAVYSGADVQRGGIRCVSQTAGSLALNRVPHVDDEMPSE